MALTTSRFLYRTLDGRYEGHGMLQQYAAAKLDGLSERWPFLSATVMPPYYLGLLSGWRTTCTALAAGSARCHRYRERQHPHCLGMGCGTGPG